MAKPDQMSRPELVAARTKVLAEIDLLTVPRVRHWASGSSSLKDESLERLHAILTEIDAELAELGPPDA